MFYSKVIWQSYSKVTRFKIPLIKKIQAIGSSSVHTQDAGDLRVHCGRNYFLHAGVIRVFFIASIWLTKRQKSHILRGIGGTEQLSNRGLNSDEKVKHLLFELENITLKYRN